MIDDYTALWVAPINDVGLPARAAEQEGPHAFAELAEARDILTPDPAINPKAVLRQIAWRNYEQTCRTARRYGPLRKDTTNGQQQR